MTTLTNKQVRGFTTLFSDAVDENHDNIPALLSLTGEDASFPDTLPKELTESVEKLYSALARDITVPLFSLALNFFVRDSRFHDPIVKGMSTGVNLFDRDARSNFVGPSGTLEDGGGYYIDNVQKIIGQSAKIHRALSDYSSLQGKLEQKTADKGQFIAYDPDQKNGYSAAVFVERWYSKCDKGNIDRFHIYFLGTDAGWMLGDKGLGRGVADARTKIRSLTADHRTELRGDLELLVMKAKAEMTGLNVWRSDAFWERAIRENITDPLSESALNRSLIPL